ncbi:MAG: biotin--[acetyl-CoA-carboxylase] ligase [Clostridiales bacterium]
MSVKNEILSILEKNQNTAISGQDMANQLGVTRAAVWKGINSLKSQGYTITATTNKGYVLSSHSDVLTSTGIRGFLGKKYKNTNIEILDTVDSTNTYAKNLALKKAPHHTIISAMEQTAARGRQGRSFFSPKDTGIYMSLILRPQESLDKALLLTVAAAVGVSQAIEEATNISPQIKWVNDIFFNGKKVGGILTEAISDFESNSLEAVIIGIGINLKTQAQDFPPELQPIATSLLIPQLTRNQLIGTIATNIFDLTENLNPDSLIAAYKKRSLVLGKEITFQKNGTTHHATVLDINEKGNLVVKTCKGTEILQSGEITLGSENYCNAPRD